MRRARVAGRLVVVVIVIAVGVGVALGTGGAVRAASAAPCSGDYVHGPERPARLRFGIDPELAGSIGTTQTPAPPLTQRRVLDALRALRPVHRQFVLRVNRLFESEGATGLRRVQRLVDRYDRAGFDSELQIRYHPSPSQTGRVGDFTRYVRQVVDMFGPDRHVLAMTVTNEINLSTSPNTSDGAYPHAEQALIEGVIAAHREALRHGWRRLRFGFTFAYRFNPVTDAAVFRGLRAGGAAFRRALGFVGVDYYPQLYPGAGTPIPTATLQMMATMRRCFLPLGGLGARVPLWITEDGYDSTPGLVSPDQQARALTQLIDTVHGAARTYGVTDYRWFNLRDNLSSSPGLFSTTGLLTSGDRRKPSFDVYRGLIRRFGTHAPAETAGRDEGRAAAGRVRRAGPSGGPPRSGPLDAPRVGRQAPAGVKEHALDQVVADVVGEPAEWALEQEHAEPVHR